MAADAHKFLRPFVECLSCHKTGKISSQGSKNGSNGCHRWRCEAQVSGKRCGRSYGADLILQLQSLATGKFSAAADRVKHLDRGSTVASRRQKYLKGSSPSKVTADAGTIWGGVGVRSAQYAGGLAKFQAYNVIRHLFGVIDRSFPAPFPDPNLEALGLTQKLMEKYHNANQDGSGWRANRDRILTAYAATKSRVRNALKAASGKSYGVRKEWRVSWWQWSVFDPPALGFEDRFHQPYWVLPTSVVLDYIRWDTNRWLFPVEVMIDGIHARVASPALRLEEEQLSNSAIVSCMLRCAGASINGRCLKLKSSLWEYEYQLNQRTTRRGLNLGTTLRKYGMMWLPADLFVWQPLAFTSDAIESVAFVHNAFRQKLATGKS